MKRLIPVLILLFFLSCSEKTPEGVLPKDKMISLLADVHLIDGYSMAMPFDSAFAQSPALYHSVFKKFGTDSARFRKSFEYYAMHPVQLDSMYKAVGRKLKKMEEDENKRLSEEAKKREKAIVDSLKQDSIKKAKEKKQQELQDAFKTKKIMKDSVNRNKKI